MIVLLLFLYPRLRGSQMVGTDLAQAIPMVGSAALAHIVFGDFKLGLTASILIGSIPGVLIGAAVSSYAPTAFLRGALAAVLLVSGLKLVQVPTLVIGIVLLASVIVLLATWLWIRASGRTLREVSGETSRQVAGRRLAADQPEGGPASRRLRISSIRSSEWCGNSQRVSSHQVHPASTHRVTCAAAACAIVGWRLAVDDHVDLRVAALSEPDAKVPYVVRHALATRHGPLRDHPVAPEHALHRLRARPDTDHPDGNALLRGLRDLGEVGSLTVVVVVATVVGRSRRPRPSG